MKTPLQVTFRDVAPPALVTDYVEERALSLENYAPEIISCKVIVESPHRRHSDGTIYHVRINIAVPGSEIVVGRDPPGKHAHEDLLVAIRDAFDAARRQLEDYVRLRRGRVKHHDIEPVARVVKIFPEDDYGFLEAADGHHIYFHRNAVLEEGFDRLEVGTMVTFAEEEGEKGPQARKVVIKQAGVHIPHEE